MEILSPHQWQARMQAHAARAATFSEPHLQRRKAGKKHPVFDFLFEYYPLRAAHLQRWSPGIGVALEGNNPLQQRKWFHNVDYLGNPTEHAEPKYTAVDVYAWMAEKENTARYIRTLLLNTSSNPAHFDCFGLHEWAMVYHDTPRHDLPLRLGANKTNEVVEEHSIRCTHYDAFRFFTPPARPLNFQVLSRETQPDTEQRGCLHATMDLFKWSSKLGPLVPGELWLDCFSLAWECRILDMEASPYDCRALGLGVVAIETAAGKNEYVRRQRDIAARGTILRERLISVIDEALATTLDT